MDYRLLATARAHEIKEKAEWEVEFDRVSIHQRMLWIGDFCLPFVLLVLRADLVQMGVLKGLSMLTFALSPTFAIAGDIDTIRYLFGSAAAVYICVVMLQINVKDILHRANRELWIIMAQIYLYLEPYIAPFLAVIFGIVPLIVGLVTFFGLVMWDILTYIWAKTPGFAKVLWTATKYIAKYLWAKVNKCEIPVPENNGNPAVNAPTAPQANARPHSESNGQPTANPPTGPTPQTDPRPDPQNNGDPAANASTEPTPQTNARQDPANNNPPAETTPTEPESGTNEPPESESRRGLPSPSVDIPQEVLRRQGRRRNSLQTHLRIPLARKEAVHEGGGLSAQHPPTPWTSFFPPVRMMPGAWRSWFDEVGVEVRQRVVTPLLSAKGPVARNAEEENDQGQPKVQDPASPLAPNFPSTHGASSTPAAAVPVHANPSTIQSPATIYTQLERRLFEYEAAVEEVEEIKKNWSSISDDLIPSKAEDYFAKVQALRSKLVADHQLLYDVQQQLGVVPRLDKVYQSLEDQLKFWGSLKRSETFRATKMRNPDGTDDNPAASKKARLVDLQDQAASDQKQFNAKKAASLAKAPIEDWTAQSRKPHPLQGEYLKPAKARSRGVSDYKWAIGEHAAQSWTHEKLHMKDATMVDNLPSSKKPEVDILQSRLEELHRETTTWHGAYFGVPIESWTLEALKKYVDENQYVPDLVLDKVSKDARLDRAILEGGLLSVDVLKHLEKLQPAADELLQQARSLYDVPMSGSSPGLTTFPGPLKEEKLVNQTRSLKTFFEATGVQARDGYRDEHQALRDSFNKALRDRHAMFHDTSDAFFFPELLNLQETATKLRETILRMGRVAINDDNLAHFRLELLGDLDEFLKDIASHIKAFRSMLPYQAQRQVNGNRESLYTFGVAVAKGLQPAPTSGENLLCGPRALVMSLQAIQALRPGVPAEDILLQMYEDFYGRRNTSLPDGVKSKLLPAYRDCVEARLGHLSASDYGLYAYMMREAENMNNFSIVQLDLMLAFLVHLGHVEDKYQIGVVSEDCEGGPWTVQIYDHGPSDDRLRETVWLYMDNAEVITEDKNEWRHYARRFQNSKYWPQEADAVLARVGRAEEPPRLAHWSGFSLPTFVNPKRQGPWGLIEPVPDNIMADNGEKKSLKDAMATSMKYWKGLEAEAERRVRANEEREKQKRQPKVEKVDKDGEEALRDFFNSEEEESEAESVIELPTSRPASPVGGSQSQRGKKASSKPTRQARQPAQKQHKNPTQNSPPQNAGQNPPQGPRVCKFFQSGDCKNGDNCNFAHIQAPQQAAPAHDQSNKPSKSNDKSTKNQQPSTNTARPEKQKPAPATQRATGNASKAQAGKSKNQKAAQTPVNSSTTATPAQKKQQSAQTTKSKNAAPKTNKTSSPNPPMPGSFPSEPAPAAKPQESKLNVETKTKAPPQPAGSLPTPPLSPDEEL
ncbi:hypothetical protein PRZ48_002474 [Zasmidium cellare]|uniref:C3H1-type domain-containing protein n=1 Tax=Zasmidium cellare TaxID=395010 RepID=A0ABR0F647_ZASCE|nr:hypothetical protein PRZ48_002474 [Zasmidium cellare]